MSTDEVTEEQVLAENHRTRDHIERVRHFLAWFCQHLHKRGVVHDQSKLEEPEVSGFVKANMGQALRGSTYGSEEYKTRIRELLGEALDHHYANNSHHPEFHDDGIDDMNLLDIVEMLMDWRAACERHKDGDIFKSIEINTKRFNMSPQLASILRNTALMMEDDPETKQ